MKYHFEIKRTVVETLDIFVASDDVDRAEIIAVEYARSNNGDVFNRDIHKVTATLVDKLHVRNTNRD
jgi:hypothetical protein